jgi:hypothetical protein
MIKQASTVGYVSISGRKIAAILLILICSLALAWATRSGRDASVKPVQPLVMHNHSKAGDKAHTHHTTFKAPVKKSSRARQSNSAGQGANQGAGHGANSKSDATPSPTPEESPGSTSDATLGSSATITGTSRWPRAAATPMPSP